MLAYIVLYEIRYVFSIMDSTKFNDKDYVNWINYFNKYMCKLTVGENNEWCSCENVLEYKCIFI